MRNVAISLLLWLPSCLVQLQEWTLLIENIARSSNLNTAPGTTLERDVMALILFFNDTCTQSQADANDVANPYRGAFAQVSQWRQQRGWQSIVRAHSNVKVQCRALYMEGGEEFVAKHCFWNVQSLQGAVDVNGTAAQVKVYPSPRWTIVEDCCEEIDRPLLRVYDAVWATTRGVGRAYRPPVAAGGMLAGDDFDYVPKLNCDDPVNQLTADCDPTMHNVFAPDSTRCDSTSGCGATSKPIGVRSHNYFNVGVAVGAQGVIIRTLDGGYSWDCLHCPTNPEPDLLAISVNVRMGGFGYSQTYYSAQGTSNIDGNDWTLLALQEGQPIYTGLDGVYWPDMAGTYMEGYAVGKAGSIVHLKNAGVNGFSTDDMSADTKSITPQPSMVNEDGTGCATKRDINDVFFWNMHLAFFVGSSGYLCRLGMDIVEEMSMRGPGRSIDDVLDGTVALRWDSQGADEQGLNWGKIIDNKDYMYSHLRAVFCLQVSELSLSQWSAEAMDAPGITYSQHITCFAVGTHPGTAGTTSAILRYQSSAVSLGTAENAIFREDVSWKPQNSRTSTTLNDVYCVKTKGVISGEFEAATPIYCYAVGDGGLIRFTSNGGASPWRTRFSGVLENLRKVVIIEVTHQTGGNGDHAVVIGDNGRVLRTSDSGNTWQKLERVTPEHLVAIQFNAFDDYYYAQGGTDLTPEFTYFENAAGQALPWANGVATGSYMYAWQKRTGSCGLGSYNAGTTTARYYECRKPELSIILRTNCQSTLQSQHWRCQSECVDKSATVPVALEDTLASDETWDAYFGTEFVVVAGQPVEQSKKTRLATALYTRVPACDEVWTIGHGRTWHEDTRETRLYQSATINPDTGEITGFTDTTAIRPVHEMCMHGWPRHKYGLHDGRRLKAVTNTTWAMPTQAEYTFLNRLRIAETNCTLLGGWYYAADGSHLEDCVFDFGTLTECPSWEVHGMGHTLDPPTNPKPTLIPFVNFSVITDPCNDLWFGITCEPHTQEEALPGATKNQTITQIWLFSNNLQGEIPHTISELRSLQAFSLGSNRLIGSIPREVWANMTQLRYLSLAENLLTGEIPDTLGNLANLEELRLHANALDGLVPGNLGSLGSLQSLSLHANVLDGEMPSELGSLSSLQYLWMSNNNFTGAVPSQIGRLSRLRYFWFANNSIDSLPEELGDLQDLRSMDGGNNAIADRLPYTLGKLSKLRVLKFGRNKIRATIPDALGMCTSLVLLELQRNELVGPIPASFGALEELTSLDLSYNLLERRLPYSIEGMRNLQILLLQNNNLEGGLPPSIGTLKRLQKLNMAGNRLTDPLPDELVECGNLEEINLRDNIIDGPLPPGIWRLQMLEYLFLTNNRVRGPLPEGLGYLAQLRELRLDKNQIDGTLPATIGDAATLEIMRMDENLLSGSLPNTIGKLRNVANLDMHQNRLGGTIPFEVSGMASAVYIYLQRNQLEGEIPPTVGNLSNLHELRVSRNKLVGEIPASLGKLQNLVHLAADNNQLQGAIPAELGMLSERLQLLHLQNNRLNGLLPTFFRLAPFRAVAINLAGNPFWCPLPAWPALNGTASCVHCPNDVYLEDDHRTCSDHGVCMDGVSCRCDAKWEGDTCNLLRCPGQCNMHGSCINERSPAACTLSGQNGTGATAGMCEALGDDCVAAYHDCPERGISEQVDSTGIVLAEVPKHNQIVFARCLCTDAYSGNDCTMPPLPPPTLEPWPDPYQGVSALDWEESAAGTSHASWRSLTLSIALATLGAVLLVRQ